MKDKAKNYELAVSKLTKALREFGYDNISKEEVEQSFDREKADKLLENEYKDCHNLEKGLSKKFKKRSFDNVQEAANFCGFLCHSLGTKPIKKPVINSKEVTRGGGHYCPMTKEIHLISSYMHINTLIHETAHHIFYREGYLGASHGKEFMEIEEMLYEAAKMYPDVCRA